MRAVMVNSNPETVSTDFDTSDRLYFEPLDLDGALHVARGRARRPARWSSSAARPRSTWPSRWPSAASTILGSSVEAIDLAEDRRAFAEALDAIGIPQPLGGTTTTRRGGRRDRRARRLPGARAAVLRARRPGDGDRAQPRRAAALHGVGHRRDAARQRCSSTSTCRASRSRSTRSPTARPSSSRASCSTSSAPASTRATRTPCIRRRASSRASSSTSSSYTVRIARHLRLRGLVNVQYVVHRGNVYVLEVNPRASRTVPFLSKVTGVPMVKLATRVMLGETLASLGWTTGLVPPRDLVAVKAPVFSMTKLTAVDSYLGPEMKSTGEAIGIDRTLDEALRKAFAASGMHVPARRRGAAHHRRRGQARDVPDRLAAGRSWAAGSSPPRAPRGRFARPASRRASWRRSARRARPCVDVITRRRGRPRASTRCRTSTRIRARTAARHQGRLRDPPRGRRAPHPLPDLARHRRRAARVGGRRRRPRWRSGRSTSGEGSRCS